MQNKCGGHPRSVKILHSEPVFALLQLQKNPLTRHKRLPLPFSQAGDFVEAESKASSIFRCKQEVGGHLQYKSRIELQLNGVKSTKNACRIASFL